MQTPTAPAFMMANHPLAASRQRVWATSAAGGNQNSSPVVKFLLGGVVAWTYEFALGQ